MQTKGNRERRLLSVVPGNRLRSVFKYLFDEREFWSPHGVRSMSQIHRDHPYIVDVNGQQYRVDYAPAESATEAFGGNSNWRGPVWFPVNFLLIEALQKFHHYFDDSVKVECPTGSGHMGIWQKVTLSASGPVVLRDPYVLTDVHASDNTADVSLDVGVVNATSVAVTGVVEGTLGDVAFQSTAITLEPSGNRTVRLSPENAPTLRLKNPALWWPNGFGDPHLYPLHLTFVTAGASSDALDFNVGVRTISYTLGDNDNLALIVNGVRVFAKGGNWGMDEAMKRVPRERLETEMRLHRDANYTIVRNWVGQSTSEDFYDLADRYGLLVWDEFFQPAAGLDSGRERGETGEQDLSDVSLYLANVREKVLRFRNHPSIALWCGRNEGAPSPTLVAGRLVDIMHEGTQARDGPAREVSERGAGRRDALRRDDGVHPAVSLFWPDGNHRHRPALRAVLSASLQPGARPRQLGRARGRVRAMERADAGTA